MTAALLVQVLPHIVLPPKIPATRKVVQLLELVHPFKGTETGAADVKVYDPVITLLCFLDAVELKGIYDAFVL